MADTIRQSILENIQTTLEGVVDIESVELDRMSPPDLETMPFPSAFIYSENETRIENGTIGLESWEWTVSIEVWSKESEVSLESLLSDIHNAMHADYRRGGYADYSFRQGVEYFYIEASDDFKGMIVSYLVRYSHVLGDSSITNTVAPTYQINHTELGTLVWVDSDHTGTASTFAGFDGNGDATEYTESNYHTDARGDARYYQRSEVDAGWYTKAEIDAGWFTRTQSDARYYLKTEIDAELQTIRRISLFNS